MDDTGTIIGLNKKIAKLQHKIDEALKVLKIDTQI